jgi:serpin B
MALRALLVCSALLAGLAPWGCGGKPAGPAAPAHLPKPGPEPQAAQSAPAGQHPGQATAESLAAERDPDPKATDAEIAQLTEGNARLGLRLLRELAKGGVGNVCVSPYSLGVAFGMVSAGAKGQTKEQIRQVLGFTLPDERLHPALNRLDLTLRPKDSGFTLHSANGMWVDPSVHVIPDFRALLSREYGAGVKQTTFPEPGRQEISDWISQHTEGRIPNMLAEGSLTDATVLALANALYFLAKWQHEFKPGSTHEAPFATPDGEVQVRTMGTLLSAPYAEGTVGGEACQVLHLAYRDSTISMVVVLPRAKGALPLESDAWVTDTLALVAKPAQAKPVVLYLPKWDLGATTELSGTLQALGMPTAFTPGEADLTAMAEGVPGEVWIDQVFHATRVTVDEAGTEASAATVVAVKTEAAPAREGPVEFRADHPFLYLIRDGKTGQILFLGRVTDPTKGAK